MGSRSADSAGSGCPFYWAPGFSWGVRHGEHSPPSASIHRLGREQRFQELGPLSWTPLSHDFWPQAVLEMLAPATGQVVAPAGSARRCGMPCHPRVSTCTPGTLSSLYPQGWAGLDGPLGTAPSEYRGTSSVFPCLSSSGPVTSLTPFTDGYCTLMWGETSVQSVHPGSAFCLPRNLYAVLCRWWARP